MRSHKSGGNKPLLWACPECGSEDVATRLRGPHVAGCRRTARAKYIYLDPAHKRPLRQSECAGCGREMLARLEQRFCSTGCSKVGALNPQWKGDGAGYLAFHQRVYYRRGKAFGCLQCGTTEDRYYEWANLTGDYADTDDYASMCKPCHSRYDIARRTGGQ